MQEIFKKIEFAACQPDIKNTDSIYYDKVEIDEAVELLKELKPIPPKCNTCNYLTTRNNDSKCNKLDVDQGGALSAWDGIEIVLIDEFGCPRHSDFDEV